MLFQRPSDFDGLQNGQSQVMSKLFARTLAICFFAILLSIPFVWSTLSQSPLRVLLTGLGLLITALAWWAASTGKLAITRLIVSIGYWTIITVLIAVSGGLGSPWLMTQLAVIGVTGLIVSWRLAFGLSLLSLLVNTGFYFVQDMVPALGEVVPREEYLAAVVWNFIVISTAFYISGLAVTRNARKAREGDLRYRSLFEKTNDAVFMIDLDYRHVAVNDNAAAWLGYEPNELVGMHIDQIVEPAEQDEAFSVVDRLEDEGMLPVYERTMVRKDGSRIKVEINIAMIHDEAGKPLYIQSVVRDITERKRLEQQLRENLAEIERQLNRLRSLREIDVAIAGSVDRQNTLNIILGEVLSELEVDAASILLFNEASGYLEFTAGKGFHSNGIERSRVRFGTGYSGMAVQDREITHAADLMSPSSDYQRRGLLEGEDFVNYWGAPLVAKGKVLGVLEVFTRKPFEAHRDWLSFFEILANHTAIALESTLLFEGLERKNQELTVAYETTLEGWAKALELRDDVTGGHTQRVTELTIELASSLGLGGQQLVSIRRGALLHDIGKIGVPDNILLKPGPLNEEEWEVMKQHPTYARELLNTIPYLADALDIPHCHHEKWDGTGYPEGLSGNDIPLAARIFSVVDVWDALLSDRPYREAWNREEVVQYLREQSGKQFDPQIVKAFLDMLDRKKESS